MDNTESIRLEDGRRAERVVKADCSDEGTVTVTELYVEPKVEKKLSKRVVEYTRPVVHRREIHTIDETTGEIVETKVESIDPSVKMELREHMVSKPKELEAESFVTRSELKDLFLSLPQFQNMSCVKDVPKESDSDAKDFFDVKKIPEKISAQEAVEQRVAKSQSLMNPVSIGLMLIVVAEVALAAWWILV
jgi:hypothetical protein